MLAKSDINIYGFPDAIEKQIYRNMFNILIKVIAHVLETIEFRFLGQKITCDIQPIEQE
jgi:hypothetical protein